MTAGAVQRLRSLGKARAKARNPNIKIIPISAKTGEGMAEWSAWLAGEVNAYRAVNGK